MSEIFIIELASPARVSPSSFAFRWSCFPCGWYEAVLGLVPPFFVASMVNVADREQKTTHEGHNLATLLGPSYPDAKVIAAPKARSKPLSFPGTDVQIILSGNPDFLLRHRHGGIGIGDYKSTQAHEGKVEMYADQLCAYAVAFSMPEDGYPAISITSLGLLIFEAGASGYGEAPDGSAEWLLRFRPAWFDVPMELDRFMSRLAEIARVLDLDEPPPPTEGCLSCEYRAAAAAAPRLIAARAEARRDPALRLESALTERLMGRSKW